VPVTFNSRVKYLGVEEVVGLLAYPDLAAEMDQKQIQTGLLSKSHNLTSFEFINNRILGHLRTKVARSKLERMLQQLGATNDVQNITRCGAGRQFVGDFA